MKRKKEKNRDGYFIKYKWLFWWFEENELQICNDGMAWNETRYFKTKKEADTFLKNTM